MTHAVAGGTSSHFPKSSGLPIQVDAGTSRTIWQRERANTVSGRFDSRPPLEPGAGPRPGGLDQLPVVPRARDDRPHRRGDVPGPGGPGGSGRLGDVLGAGRRAINQEIRQHPFQTLLHPKIAVFSALVIFIANLLSGKK